MTDRTSAYGVYMSTNWGNPAIAELYLFSYSFALGDAQNAKRTAAAAQLQRRNRSDANLLTSILEENIIDLVDQHGRRAYRYEVLDGHLEDGGFINQQDWEAGVREPERVAFHWDYVNQERRAIIKRKIREPQRRPAEQRVRRDTVVADVAGGGGDANRNELFCVCQQPNDGTKYIQCSGGNFPNSRWCHMRCVNLRRAPRGNWYCPACRGTE